MICKIPANCRIHRCGAFPEFFRLFVWVAARLLHTERARKDSNLRPSLLVVILLHGQGGTVGDGERQNPAFSGNFGLLKDREGQGETPGCSQTAVKKSAP